MIYDVRMKCTERMPKQVKKTGLTSRLLQLGSSDELEGKFAKLEGDDVDQELSEMKKGLLTGSKSKQSLPEGRSQGKSEGRPYK